MQFFLLIIILIPSISCSSGTRSKAEGSKQHGVQITPPATDQDSAIEPLFSKGYYIKPSTSKNRLILDSLTNGYDSLQIRLWIVDGLFGNRQLYLLKNTKGKWQANYYELSVDSNYANRNGSRAYLRGAEPLYVSLSKAASPKMGWQKLVDSLLSLQILGMPDMSEVKGMDINWTHPTGYFVEVATANKYRYYKYYDPHRFGNKFWQAVNLQKIESLLYGELVQ